MNNNKTRIVAAVVDIRNLTLYKKDGEMIVIPQGDPRVRLIVESATPQIMAQGWADIVLAEEVENSYADFEEKSSGLVKFFRVAKAKIKEVFSRKPADPVPERVVGHVPTTKDRIEAVVEADRTVVPIAEEPVPVLEDIVGTRPTAVVLDDVVEEPEPIVEDGPKMPPRVEQTMAAVAEIMQHAIPVSSKDFHEKGIAKQANVVEANGTTPDAHTPDHHDDTIIAVVDGKVIPGMERIKTQFARAAKLGSTAGVEKFLARLAKVIESRSHSVEDLLKFMERGDLPIADDGSILIYKVLRRSGKDAYVDCHTRKVEQFIGAYVCMDPSLVDHNRNNECSNGLHVARRGYVKGFSGDVCVLAKLAPEDVITVPSYDANKMRVCGYHILFELSDRQYGLLNQNKPITEDPDGKRILGLAMTGQHIHRTHEVRITKQSGEGVIKTPLIHAQAVEQAPAPAKAPEEIEKIADVLPNAQEKVVDAPVDPKHVAKKVEEVKVLSKREQAHQLYVEWQNAKPAHKETAFAALVDFKKQAKKGWDTLGITDPAIVNFVPKLAKAKQVEIVELEGEQDRRGLDLDNDPAPKSKAKKAEKRVVKEVDFFTIEGSPRERIQKLLTLGLDSKTAKVIKDIKKAAKKSWDVLGVSDEQLEEISKLIGK